jgi:hypothetical protein
MWKKRKREERESKKRAIRARWRDPRGVVAEVETGCSVSCHRVTDPIMFQIGTRDRQNVPLPNSFLLEQLSSNTIVHHGRPLESPGTKGRYFHSSTLPLHPALVMQFTIDYV